MSIKVGDRVEYAGSFLHILGEQGTVVLISNYNFHSSTQYLVNFINDVNGFGDKALGVPVGHGLWISESDLRKIGVSLSKTSTPHKKQSNIIDYLNIINMSEQKAVDIIEWYRKWMNGN